MGEVQCTEHNTPQPGRWVQQLRRKDKDCIVFALCQALYTSLVQARCIFLHYYYGIINSNNRDSRGFASTPTARTQQDRKSSSDKYSSSIDVLLIIAAIWSLHLNKVVRLIIVLVVLPSMPVAGRYGGQKQYGAVSSSVCTKRTTY